MKIIDKKKIMSELKLRPLSLITGAILGGLAAGGNVELSSLEKISLLGFAGIGISSITYADKIQYNRTQNKEKWKKNANLINSSICLANYSVGAVIGYYGVKFLKSF
jgi:hypothetical protein